MLNLTQIISSPKVEFSYPASFLISLSINKPKNTQLFYLSSLTY